MTELESAWQGALAAEEQAVFGYGLLGARLAGPNRALAQEYLSAHATLRDDTQSAIASVGLTPVPPDADYPALYPVPNPAAARALAIRLEDACAVAWRYLYLAAASSDTGRDLRAPAQLALTQSALRGMRWRRLVDPQHATVPFPGLRG